MATKMGLIGVGGLGAMHYRGLVNVPEVEIVAICDVRQERLDGNWGGTQVNIESAPGAGVDLGKLRKFKDYNRLLRQDDIEAVLIATPTFLHSKIAIKALKMGKHVFSEKPMALNSRDAAKMIQASKDAGKILQIGHVLRFWPEYVAIKQMIDDGRYGKVRSAIFQRICGTPAWSWENWYARAECSGGGILDLHIHDVDLVNWYFGRPSRVSSTGVYVPSEGVRSVCTNYTCQTAPMVTAIGGWYTHCSGFLMALTVEFDQATVEYASNLSPTLKICSAAGVETPTFPTMDAYQEEVKYFLQCIVGGQKPDRVPPEATADAVKIVEAEARSVKTGKSVAVK